MEAAESLGTCGKASGCQKANPAGVCLCRDRCGRRGLEQSTNTPLATDLSPAPPPVLILGGLWVCSRVGKVDEGTSALSRDCAFSQGCENQDTFPWGLLCPIKLKQINFADGITALTSHRLVPFALRLERVS